jgi:hypothetical protein
MGDTLWRSGKGNYPEALEREWQHRIDEMARLGVLVPVEIDYEAAEAALLVWVSQICSVANDGTARAARWSAAVAVIYAALGLVGGDGERPTIRRPYASS